MFTKFYLELDKRNLSISFFNKIQNDLDEQKKKAEGKNWELNLKFETTERLEMEMDETVILIN